MSHTSEKWRKELKEMMQDETNKYCADCGCFPATWASANVGVFLCVACSGIHRSLGVHISFVKSATLDDWNDKLFLRFKQQGGNDMVNRKYEAKLKSIDKINQKFHIDQSRKIDVIKFIRNKYEKKIWYKDVNKKRKKSSKTKAHKTKPKPAAKPKDTATMSTQRVYSLTPTPGMTPFIPFRPKRKDSFLSDDDLDEFHKDFTHHPKQPNQTKTVPDILDLIQESAVQNQSVNVSNNNEMKRNDSAKDILSKYYNNHNMNGYQYSYQYQNQYPYNNNNYNNNYGQNAINYQYQQAQQPQLSPIPMNTAKFYRHNAKNQINNNTYRSNGNNNNRSRKITW